MFSFFKKIPSISTSEYQANKNHMHSLLLDVREPHEFRNGHIPGAVNVPIRKLSNYSIPKNKEKIYVICQSGMRSRQGAKILAQKGYAVTNIRGGMNAWNGPTKGGKN